MVDWISSHIYNTNIVTVDNGSFGERKMKLLK